MERNNIRTTTRGSSNCAQSREGHVSSSMYDFSHLQLDDTLCTKKSTSRPCLSCPIHIHHNFSRSSHSLLDPGQRGFRSPLRLPRQATPDRPKDRRAASIPPPQRQRRFPEDRSESAYLHARPRRVQRCLLSDRCRESGAGSRICEALGLAWIPCCGGVRVWAG